MLGSKPNFGSKPKLGGFSKPFAISRNNDNQSGEKIVRNTTDGSGRYDEPETL